MAKKRQPKWIVAIAAVLSESDQPMTAEEIAREAIARQLVDSNSLWPAHSVRTIILRHVASEGNTQSFVIGGTNKLRLYSVTPKTPIESATLEP